MGRGFAAEDAPLAAALPSVRTLDLGGGVSMEFVLIPAGEFFMGSHAEAGEGDETPRHRVRITRPFYLGVCEVSQAQWERVLGERPSRFSGADLPVDSVSWEVCRSFLAALSERSGERLRLPTEAEWEYACRAGDETAWSWGDSAVAADQHAWTSSNAGGSTRPVGQKLPNAWGLRDMHGNVWEWCADWYARYPKDGDAKADPSGPASGASRVLRGGTWCDVPEGARSATRNCLGPAEATEGVGLRCVLEVEPSAPRESAQDSGGRSLSVSSAR